MKSEAPLLRVVPWLAEPSEREDYHARGLLPGALDRAAMRAAMTLPRIYTPTEAGAILQVHAKTVIRLCYDGKFPGARQVGRSWRIPETAIAAYFGIEEDERDASLASETTDDTAGYGLSELAAGRAHHLGRPRRIRSAAEVAASARFRALLRAPLATVRATVSEPPRQKTPPMLEPGMLTLAMAAGALNVNVSRVRAMCRAGKIPGAQRVGNSSWRIPEDAIEALKSERPKRSAGGGK